MEYLVVVEKGKSGYGAHVPDLPGCVAVGESRRDFLKTAAVTGAAAAGVNLFTASPASANGADPPEASGRPGRRYVIRGGAVMSMDPNVGNFAKADVMIEGTRIVAVGPNLPPGGGTQIDATGRIVMPGFIDTHHHQFETALRSFLADGVLINDLSGSASGSTTYYKSSSTSSLRCTARRTFTSTSCSAGSVNSTPVSPPCTTYRRSVIRRRIRTPPSRR